MRSRPPKYTQRPGAEILVLRRAGFPYGAVFAGWRADSSATQNSDSPTDSWATTAPLSFSMRNNSPAPNAGPPGGAVFAAWGGNAALWNSTAFAPVADRKHWGDRCLSHVGHGNTPVSLSV